jgi:hypothetical protein
VRAAYDDRCEGRRIGSIKQSCIAVPSSTQVGSIEIRDHLFISLHRTEY